MSGVCMQGTDTVHAADRARAVLRHQHVPTGCGAGDERHESPQGSGRLQ